jgi:hypothetical protein
MDKLLKKVVVYLVKKYQVKNGDFYHFKNLEFWQANGFSIIPNHYYQPIPDLTSIKKEKKEISSQMVGVDFKEKEQLSLLNKLAVYKKQFVQFKGLTSDVDVQQDYHFFFKNAAFDGVDALLYYGLIKYLKPKRIIEVGSGWSTKIAATACRENKQTELISIEPYPQSILEEGFDGLSKLKKEKIQDVSSKYFDRLKKGDVLFIDSSHTVKFGGDVNYLLFEILPRLNKGVYVHVHDIFFPFDYPQGWIFDEYRFWAEQYLLHAFLMFNDSFEVVYSNSYMGEKHPKEVKRVFSNSPFYKGGSIWLRKIK